MKILYEDARILAAIKPAGIISTDDGEGCMPELVRKALGSETACVRTVHRLDAVVSGVMLFARSQAAASILSQQIRDGQFDKTYLAVVRGAFSSSRGQMEDLLWYNRSLRKSRVMDAPGKDVKRALLSYEVLGHDAEKDISLVKIRLHTGRTHQIRIQFSSRGHALLGDRKYGAGEEDGCGIALWSYSLSFLHPQTGEPLTLCARPPDEFPWDLFEIPESK